MPILVNGLQNSFGTIQLLLLSSRFNDTWPSERNNFQARQPTAFTLKKWGNCMVSRIDRGLRKSRNVHRRNKIKNFERVTSVVISPFPRFQQINDLATPLCPTYFITAHWKCPFTYQRHMGDRDKQRICSMVHLVLPFLCL